MQDILIAVIGSSAFTVIINTLVELLKNRTGRKSKTDKALNFCLLYTIQSYGKEIMQEQSISPEEYKQFMEMYNTYKSLGGNGYVDRLKEEVKQKPISN